MSIDFVISGWVTHRLTPSHPAFHVPCSLHSSSPSQTISEEELAGRNLLIVGDVHGCYDELVELLDKCGCGMGGPTPTAGDNNLCVIFAGDLINKGPKSAAVVKRVRAMGPQAYSVRGNHDEVRVYN